MTSFQNRQLISLYKTFANYSSLVVIIVGLLVIGGWALNLPLLKSVFPGFATMKANTAISFVLTGTALWLVNDETARREKIWIARSCAAFVTILGILTLWEYIFAQNLGIDQLIFRDTETLEAAHPGRISFTTAIDFVLIGVALYILSIPHWKEERISQFLALAAVTIAFLALIGYLYGVESLYQVGSNSSMALHSAVSFVLLGIGICCARPKRGFMQLITAEEAEGEMVRRLLPFVLGMPVILGWLRLWGERSGFYDTSFGLALMVILTTALLIIVIWRNAAWLHQASLERKQVEKALRERERQMTALITSLDDVIFEFDEHGTYLNVWTADESMLAQPKSQLLGRRINDVLGEENGRPFTEAVKRVVVSGHSEVIEYALQVLGGQRWFIARINPIIAQDNRHRTASMLIRDITQRKHVEEQNRFQANLVASVADAIIATDMQLNIRSWNTGAETMYGWKEEEVLGQPAKEILDTDFVENTREAVTKQIMEQGYWQGEVSQLRRDGTRIPTLSSVSLYKDSEGKPAGVVAVNRDITERKQAEATVAASQKRLQSLIEHAPDGIALLGRNGKLQQVTPSVQKILGYTLQEAVEQDPASLTHPDDLPNLLGLLSDLIQNPGKVITTEYRFKHKDGSWRWLESTISNLIAEPSVEAIVFNYRDITEQKEAGEEILRLNEELEQRVIERTQQLEVANRELETVNKELEAFSYSVSHDLRAPLRTIDGFTHALLEDYDQHLPEEGQNFLTRIRTATRRMAELIDALLSLAGVTRKSLERVSVDLGALATKIFAELQSQQPDRHVSCSISEDLIVNGDRQLLQIALENLIGNAWKFTAKWEDAHIEVGIQEDIGEQIYFIRDNGAGFNMDYKDRLFGAFQRLHSMAEYPGTGIGLATVQRIIHRHGGRIWAESTIGQGTTFYFTIPEVRL
jgi:PAS domain S-box-containing protein